MEIQYIKALVIHLKLSFGDNICPKMLISKLRIIKINRSCMKNIKKTLLTAMTCLLVGGAVTGCGKKKADLNTLNIVVLIPGLLVYK